MVAACPFPASRGTPIRIEQMGDALHQAGCEVHTVTYHLGDDRKLPPMELHRIRHIPFYRNFSAGPNYTKLCLLDPLLTIRLAQVIRREKVQVVHAHHFEGALCALAVRWLLGGFQVIYDSHTSLRDELLDYSFRVPRTFKKVVSDLLDSGIPRLADHVVCVSDELHRFMVDRGIPEEKVSVIPMGVNTGDFLSVSQEGARKKLKLPDDPLVVYTGNLASFQGVALLIRSWKHVVQKRSNARLLIVGRPSNSCIQVARDAGVAHAIEFVGERPFVEVREYLAAADVVVLPRSRCVGFPLKLLNYMAAGKAIVAFRGSGREVLHHLENAYVAEDGSAESFARGILECLENPRLSSRIGKAARETARDFNMDAMVQRVRALYSHLLPPISSCPPLS